jgi:hypothetical protein
MIGSDVRIANSRNLKSLSEIPNGNRIGRITGEMIPDHLPPLFRTGGVPSETFLAREPSTSWLFWQR